MRQALMTRRPRMQFNLIHFFVKPKNNILQIRH